MQDFIAQFGDFAPIVFLILASILPIFLFPPGIGNSPPNLDKFWRAIYYEINRWK